MGGIRDCLDMLSTRYRYSLYRPAIVPLSSRYPLVSQLKKPSPKRWLKCRFANWYTSHRCELEMYQSRNMPVTIAHLKHTSTLVVKRLIHQARALKCILIRNPWWDTLVIVLLWNVSLGKVKMCQTRYKFATHLYCGMPCAISLWNIPLQYRCL